MTISLTRTIWQANHKDLPYVCQHPMIAMPEPFPRTMMQRGLYVIVDHIDWLERLISLGVQTWQLRLKNIPMADVDLMVRDAIQLARLHHAALYINDYWALALKHGAYGIHLGQEDIAQADLGAIRAAGCRLGVSTHNYIDIARAKTLAPSYIACGPVFHTITKTSSHTPIGLARLAHYRQVISCSMVAIGGITLDNLAAVMRTGVDNAACISLITQAQDPEQVINTCLALIKG